MVFQPKTVFITGGASGIGRGLAEVLHKQGSKVVIAGRRIDALKDVCKHNPGMEFYTLDVCDRAAVQRAAKELPEQFGPFDCLFNNAGVMRAHDLKETLPLDYGDLEVDSNVKAVLSVTAAFLPHLLQQTEASIINITSGLAYVPKTENPVYCATKAFARSFTLSLRHQLKGTSVKVIELAPPAVQSELHDFEGPQGRQVGMPLSDFINEAMESLNAGHDQILVGQAKFMAQSPFEQVFDKLNPPQ